MYDSGRSGSTQLIAVIVNTSESSKPAAGDTANVPSAGGAFTDTTTLDDDAFFGNPLPFVHVNVNASVVPGVNALAAMVRVNGVLPLDTNDVTGVSATPDAANFTDVSFTDHLAVPLVPVTATVPTIEMGYAGFTLPVIMVRMPTTGTSGGCIVSATAADAVRVASYTVTVRTATTPLPPLGADTDTDGVFNAAGTTPSGHTSDTDGCVCTQDHTKRRPAAAPVRPCTSSSYDIEASMVTPDDPAAMLCCAPPAMTATTLPGTTFTVTALVPDVPLAGSRTDSAIVYTLSFSNVYGGSENV